MDKYKDQDSINKVKKGIDTVLTETSTTTIGSADSSDTESVDKESIDKESILKEKIMNNLNRIKLDNLEYSDASDTCFIKLNSKLDSDDENIIKININSDISAEDLSVSSDSELSSIEGVSYID
jgi:hypothetical protein